MDLLGHYTTLSNNTWKMIQVLSSTCIFSEDLQRVHKVALYCLNTEIVYLYKIKVSVERCMYKFPLSPWLYIVRSIFDKVQELFDKTHRIVFLLYLVHNIKYTNSQVLRFAQKASNFNKQKYVVFNICVNFKVVIELLIKYLVDACKYNNIAFSHNIGLRLHYIQ